MPELPEVEMFKRYIDATSLHQQIDQVIVKTKKILRKTSEKKLKTVLKNNSFTEAKRIGKHLFLKLDTGSWMVLHFGMTGKVSYFKNSRNQPDHTRMLIEFGNDYCFAFDCQRLFGFVRIIDTIKAYVEEKKLGPDALHISQKEFLDDISRRHGKIKSVLMNQHILSGIGNIYADEILFQTRIHPATSVDVLSKKQRKKLFDTISSVLTTAVEKKADFNKYPDEFLIPHRSKQGVCPLNDNHQLKTMKISGRTSYFCPIHQKKKKSD
ncbi:MAG: DNA-formamidopyrimidine glycosylase family protein [Thermoplasmatota archaeon]